MLDRRLDTFVLQECKVVPNYLVKVIGLHPSRLSSYFKCTVKYCMCIQWTALRLAFPDKTASLLVTIDLERAFLGDAFAQFEFRLSADGKLSPHRVVWMCLWFLFYRSSIVSK